MIKRLIFALLLTPLFLSLVSCTGDNNSKNNSTPSIAELRGQWVVINYWAKWCKPCIKEIPELNELDQHYPQVTVLGVNYDGATGEELATQLASLGVEFAMLQEDPAASLGLPRPVVLPTTIILDPNGQVSQSLIGPQTMASLARATHQSP
ncbi:MAG: TlpA family protein disulfide reductase [Proteobacteria bacterium]|nr:TlpA family protein disulfide reductase [Pseudomonadota bacterium]